MGFQSPRGDFGFLKIKDTEETVIKTDNPISIPSRGFWFFEVMITGDVSITGDIFISIPSRGFWFFEGNGETKIAVAAYVDKFQSPRGDFGFLKIPHLRPLCKRLYRAFCAVRFY